PAKLPGLNRGGDVENMWWARASAAWLGGADFSLRVVFSESKGEQRVTVANCPFPRRYGKGQPHRPSNDGVKRRQRTNYRGIYGRGERSSAQARQGNPDCDRPASD